MTQKTKKSKTPAKAQKPVKARKPAKKAKSPRKLTPKQEVFAHEYLGNGFNGTQAAKAAGYRGNDDVLAHVAVDNLRNPQIAIRVRERIDGIAATSDEVLYLLADHLRADVADFDGLFLPDGRIDLKEARRLGVSRLIKKLEYEPVSLRANTEAPACDKCGFHPLQTRFKTRVEFHDSQGAARTLVQVHGLLKQPAANPSDAEWARTELDRLKKKGYSDEEAKEMLLEAEPRASEFLQ
jgi:hypothetical protein